MDTEPVAIAATQIRHAGGLFGKHRDDDVAAQCHVWQLIRRHFAHARHAPRLVLMGVDPWPNRPPIQPWLDEHFAGRYRRRGQRVVLDPSVLDAPVAMDLFTNTMRTRPAAASGRASAELPLIHAIALQLEHVEMSTVLGFLQAFDAGNTWGRPLGSLAREHRPAVRRFVEADPGRVVVHPTMGVSNVASVYASPGKTLDPVIGELAAQLCAWRAALRA